MTTLADLLPEHLSVGAPQRAGALTVFPLFGGDPRLEYQSFVQAQSLGATVSELPEGASVNDLLVHNPSALPVLLFEGEEVLGAQQNRTFDVSALVPAGTKLRVPVSCVEAGRWDGARHGEAFRAAPQAAYPALRRTKNAAARASAARGGEARAEQSAVWDDVAAKGRRLGAQAPTGAMHDVFGSRRASLDDLTRLVERQGGQLGAIAAIGGRCVVLDYVSRSDVWTALHGPLVQGYALDALEVAAASAPPSSEDAAAFLGAAIGTPAAERSAIGSGVHLDVANAMAAGTALACEGELVQLSAFAPQRRTTRVLRPSARR